MLSNFFIDKNEILDLYISFLDHSECAVFELQLLQTFHLPKKAVHNIMSDRKVLQLKKKKHPSLDFGPQERYHVGPHYQITTDQNSDIIM